jgi:hypothetical protein
MSEAVGIHAHPSLKLGLAPNDPNRDSLDLSPLLSGYVPKHPVAVNHFGKVEFGLYENDKFGDCGPTGVCNLVRLVSTALTGKMVAPSQDDCFTLYRQSGNPDFDPETGAGDNGVSLQVMLEALLKNGIGDGKGGVVKPVAFGKVNAQDEAELDAAVSIFGGLLWGVDLDVAQQAQSSEKTPVWEYVKSADWGGHCVMNGEYNEAQNTASVISWDENVMTSSKFRQEQLQEAWAVIWPWNVGHPAFQAGINAAALAAAFKELTGTALGVQAEPAVSSGEGHDHRCSVDPADRDLHARLTIFRGLRLYGQMKEVGEAFDEWMDRKGLK